MVLNINEYNNKVGQLYIKKPSLFELSPTLCRCEGQTFNYEKYSKGFDIKNYFLNSLIKFIGKFLRDILLSLFAIRIKKKFQKDLIFVFSFFDLRNIKDDFIKEEYFRNILENNNKIVCFYKLSSPGFFSRGKKYLDLIESKNKNFECYAEYSFISFKMILKSLVLTFKHYFLFVNFIKNQKDYSKLNTLIYQAHVKEILDGTIYGGYLQKELYKKILINRPKTILSVWENQPWQRILETVKKEISPLTVSKGFQHTGFSKKLLQHYPSKYERDLLSYPDQLLCNGEINKNELMQNSNIQSNIIVGAALRQDQILNNKNFPKEGLRFDELNSIAFSFSWDQANYDEILSDLILLPDQFKEIHLKFHPLYPDWLKRKFSNNRFINSSESWLEISKKCKLLIASDNSLIFEGYFYGMHTAIYDGYDPQELSKRDFESPIEHLNKDDIIKLNSYQIINKINDSTKKLIDSKYLSRYFVERELQESKKIFLE